jgi:hypothetical protein
MDAQRLIMYGQPAEGEQLDWSWVDAELRSAGVYWVVAADTTGERPQTRPVWGVWRDPRLLLSIGSPKVNAAIHPGSPVTVHLGGDVDVVIVEGRAGGSSDDPGAVAQYDDKYDWAYSVDAYGPFTAVVAETVLAWRAAGFAGRDGFRATGKWRFGN